MQQTRLSKAHSACISRYLDTYAEPEARSVSGAQIGQFDTLIVIPVYDEAEPQLQAFLKFNNSRSVLMIWVFNAPESASGSPAHLRTVALQEKILRQLQAQPLSSNCYFAQVHGSLKLLVVDRCQHLIPDKQGVGLARKIGADLALQLSYQQYLHSGYLVPWIFSTDADVSLPAEYALLDAAEPGVSACIHGFFHRPEAGYEQAMRQYEFSLYYYVDRLRYAASPYAFHTIGSLIAIQPLAYAQVRGFPKRSGAEDFYLLNKLAKVGRIETLASPIIEIAGRPSHRVPFGTGPALIKINTDKALQKNFQVYHPRTFELLRALLASLTKIENSISDSAIPIVATEFTMLTSRESQVITEVLMALGWDKQKPHWQQQKNSQAFQQAFHTWFDAFLTLRFVHEVRDRLYPNIDLSELPDLFKADTYTGVTVDYLAWFEELGIS